MVDYLELTLTDDESVTTDVWVHFRSGEVKVLKTVSSVIRYQGVWTIGYELFPHQGATAHIPAEDVLFFSTLEKRGAEDQQQREVAAELTRLGQEMASSDG